jgi:Asp-tRNA(Asn)/Glu-tRNA(Gln) amidotransferase A subunit family amidase
MTNQFGLTGLGLFFGVMLSMSAQANDWHIKTIGELQRAMSRGEVTAEALTKYFTARIEAYDTELNSVLVVNPKAAEIAKQLDAERAKGNLRGPLHGIPILIKDNIDTDDNMPTTAGSILLKDHFPGRDAFIVKQLRQAGAVILGKTNLSEWANFRSEKSSSGWSSVGGQTGNAYDVRRSPCGSSSGSGAAVAAGLAPAAIGTETSGSIICPSQINNLVGIKPSVGSVSRTGIVPISSSQDTAGPMTNSVADAVMVLNAIMGKDETDVSSFEQAPFDIEPIDLNGIRFGLVTNLMGYLAEVDDLTVKAVEVLKAHGAEVQDCELTRPGYASRLSYQVMQYEFKAGMASYLQQTNAKYKNLAELIEANEAQREVTLEHFGQEIFEASNKKGDLNDEAYLQAKKQSFEMSGPDGIDATLSACQADVLIAPSGSPAWMIDHVLGDHYLGGSAGPAASSGYPHITVPMGFVAGLPVGISFFSGRGSMQKLIGVAMTYEALTQHRALPVQYR